MESSQPTSPSEYDSWLPQVHCARCGYPGCFEYAEAMAEGQANINLCPPGESATLRGLAALTRSDPISLSSEVGLATKRHYAVVDEANCIGCTLCIQVCPVDAIVGAAKCMHSVINTFCTGCERCLPVCPVECIIFEPTPVEERDSLWKEYTKEEVESSRERYRLRRLRLNREVRQNALQSAALSTSNNAVLREEVLGAVARVRKRRLSSSHQGKHD